MPAALALTFDDGPDPRGTTLVLDALASVRARATFFVIAPCAERHAHLLHRIAAAGHRIGLHCERHVRHTELGEAHTRADTTVALRRLARLVPAPTLWRVPWGVQAPWTTAVADEFGLELVGWDVDTHDWRGDSADRMFADTEAGLVPGAVVLAHDGIGPGALRDDCAQTAAYVELVADRAAAQGLSLAAL